MRLSREQVLNTALGLLDEVGLEHLTMRRLATTLGVQNRRHLLALPQQARPSGVYGRHPAHRADSRARRRAVMG